MEKERGEFIVRRGPSSLASDLVFRLLNSDEEVPGDSPLELYDTALDTPEFLNAQTGTTPLILEIEETRAVINDHHLSVHASHEQVSFGRSEPTKEVWQSTLSTDPQKDLEPIENRDILPHIQNEKGEQSWKKQLSKTSLTSKENASSSASTTTSHKTTKEQ